MKKISGAGLAEKKTYFTTLFSVAGSSLVWGHGRCVLSRAMHHPTGDDLEIARDKKA